MKCHPCYYFEWMTVDTVMDTTKRGKEGKYVLFTSQHSRTSHINTRPNIASLMPSYKEHDSVVSNERKEIEEILLWIGEKALFWRRTCHLILLISSSTMHSGSISNAIFRCVFGPSHAKGCEFESVSLLYFFLSDRRFKRHLFCLRNWYEYQVHFCSMFSTHIRFENDWMILGLN